MSVSEEHLALLAQSPNKEVVTQIFQTCYSSRKSTVASDVAAKIGESLSLDVAQTSGLLNSVIAVINIVIFESLATKEDIAGVLPAGLQGKLKSLIASVILANLSTWQQATFNSQISLPKLTDFDWRIDVKTASQESVRMGVPTCLIELKVETLPERVDEMASQRSVSFEVTRDTLDTVLDGLFKIRDQLALVATTPSE
eukprot:m.48221 g.48221  ORF g.48221 m.48221 type:complete len:199 (+) comp47688_c0_seq2:66-662(+)